MSFTGVRAARASQLPIQSTRGGRPKRPVSKELPAWFSEHVDRIAMRDGLDGSDAYLEQLNWTDYIERDGSAETVGGEVLAELEAQWAPVRTHCEETGELD